jgi:hypothetical protein
MDKRAPWCASRRINMSFGLYIVGFIVLIIGLALGANLLHVPPQWIGVGVVVLIGLGILTGVTITRQRRLGFVIQLNRARSKRDLVDPTDPRTRDLGTSAARSLNANKSLHPGQRLGPPTRVDTIRSVTPYGPVGGRDRDSGAFRAASITVEYGPSHFAFLKSAVNRRATRCVHQFGC